MQTSIQTFQQNLAPHRDELLRHGIYQSLHTLEDLQVFMQYHVFAVWDFMSLLKGLQKELTCITVPWVPVASPAVRRLINEIVLEEESGLDQDGNAASHFEMYLRAMQECGADTRAINHFLELVRADQSVFVALKQAPVPEPVRDFVKYTFQLLQQDKPHVLASAFAFGRKDVIPGMFRHLIADLSSRFPGALSTFNYYLERQIRVDQEVQTPQAMRMMAELCGDDPEKWQEAEEAARGSMQARIKLWSGIRLALPERSR